MAVARAGNRGVRLRLQWAGGQDWLQYHGRKWTEVRRGLRYSRQKPSVSPFLPRYEAQRETDGGWRRNRRESLRGAVAGAPEERTALLGKSNF